MLTSAQVAAAITFNDGSADARANVPALRAVFGRPGAVDRFDAALCALVADYQFGAGLAADGKLGPKTIAKLIDQRYLVGPECAAIWPLPDEKRPDVHWRKLLALLGIPFSAARTALLGIRGAYPFATQAHRLIHSPRFDDTFVLCAGGVPPVIFRGSTHAYQARSGESPDVGSPASPKPDGKGDVGSIRPGVYKLTFRDKTPIFELTMPDGSREIPCHRDVDGDGFVSEEEAERSEQTTTGAQAKPGAGMFATAVLFHPGFNDTKPGTDRSFSSIACQTAELRDVRNLLAVGGRVIDYALATAEQVADCAHVLRATPDPEPELEA